MTEKDDETMINPGLYIIYLILLLLGSFWFFSEQSSSRIDAAYKALPPIFFAHRIILDISSKDFQSIDGDIVEQLILMNISEDFWEMVERSDIKFNVADDRKLTASEALYVVNSVLSAHYDSEEYKRIRQESILKRTQEKQEEIESNRADMLRVFNYDKK
jgi:hypothetical protein